MTRSAVKPAAVLLFDREAVSSILTLDECIAAVESAFAAHALGRSLAPQLMHVDADGGEFHIKAGGVRGRHGDGSPTYFACKINGGFFDNKVKLGLPNIIGLILLCDGTDGSPLALMESGFITTMRTGAATAVAAKYLARADSRSVTVCGAGIQSEMQLRSLMRVLPIDRAFLWARSDCAAAARRMSRELNLDVRPAPDLTAATLQSDVIVTCTPAKRWFLSKEQVRPGTFIAAVGTDSPDKQELEPALLAGSSVVCDLVEQCSRVGDLHHAMAAGLMDAEEIRGQLGAVIAGHAPKRLQDDEVIIFDSTGTALQDTAAAALVYEGGKARAGGTSFAFWG
jgi:alanine dehydrogenase